MNGKKRRGRGSESSDKAKLTGAAVARLGRTGGRPPDETDPACHSPPPPPSAFPFRPPRSSQKRHSPLQTPGARNPGSPDSALAIRAMCPVLPPVLRCFHSSSAVRGLALGASAFAIPATGGRCQGRGP